MSLKTYDDFTLATQYAFHKISENAGVKYDDKLNKDFKAILDGVNKYNQSISTKAYEQRKALVKDIQIADLCEKNQINYDPKIAKAFGEILENNGKYKATDAKLLAELTPKQKEIEKLCQANNIKYTKKTEQALETILEQTKNSTKITLNSDFGFAEGRDAANAGKIIDKTQIIAKESEFVPMFNQEEIKNYRALSQNIDPKASKTDIAAAKTDISIRVLSERYRPQLETDSTFLADKSRQQGKLSDYIQKQNQVITNIYKELDVSEIKDILKRNNVPRSPYYNQDLQFLPTIDKLAKNTNQQLKDLFKDNNIPADKLKQTKEQVSGLVRNYINAVSPEASIIASDKLPKNYQENLAQYTEANKRTLGTAIFTEQYPKRVTSVISQELNNLKEYIQDSKNFPGLEPTKQEDLKEKFNQITTNIDFEKPNQSVANKIDSYKRYCAELETKLTNSLENTKMNRRDVAKKVFPALGKTLLNALKLDVGKARQEMNKFTTENQDRKNQRENLETTIGAIQAINSTLEKVKPVLEEKIHNLQQEKVDDKFLASNKQQINERAQAQLTKETMLADANASKNNDLQHFINRTKDIAGITTQDLEKGVEQSAQMAPVNNKKSPLQNRLAQANTLAGRPVKRTAVPRKSALASNIITNKENNVPQETKQNTAKISPLATSITPNEQVATAPSKPSSPKPMGQRRPVPARKFPNKGQAQTSSAVNSAPIITARKNSADQAQDRSNIPKSRLAQKQASQDTQKIRALRGSINLTDKSTESTALNRSSSLPNIKINDAVLSQSTQKPSIEANDLPKPQVNTASNTIRTSAKQETVVQTQDNTRADALWAKLANRKNTKFLTNGTTQNSSTAEKMKIISKNISLYKDNIQINNINSSFKLGPVDEDYKKITSKDTKIIDLASKALAEINNGKIEKVDNYLKRIDDIDRGLRKTAAIGANDHILQPLAQKSASKVQKLQSERNTNPNKTTIEKAKNIGISMASLINEHTVQKIAPSAQAKVNNYRNKKEGRGRS